MMNIEECKKVFDEHGGMVQSKHLQEAKILYRQLQKLIEQGYVEKVRYGYYRWVDHDDFSEVGIVIQDDELRAIARDFNVQLREDFLD